MMIVDSLGMMLRSQLPKAWIVPNAVGKHERPEMLEDDVGWYDVAQTLYWELRPGQAAVDRVVGATHPKVGAATAPPDFKCPRSTLSSTAATSLRRCP